VQSRHPHSREPAFANIHFFPPVKGIISSNFDARTRHYATDIVTQPKAVVSSTLDGTVIMTGWTMETGFVMMPFSMQQPGLRLQA
jgi:murein DD-endopeptidase MepM/ murein hydrolase activator NlpD